MADKERHNLLSGGSSSGGGRLERSRLVLGSSDADGPCEEDCCCREKKGLFEEQETSRCYACRRPGKSFLCMVRHGGWSAPRGLVGKVASVYVDATSLSLEEISKSLKR